MENEEPAKPKEEPVPEVRATPLPEQPKPAPVVQAPVIEEESFRFSKKEILMFIAGTVLCLPGLCNNDPWILYPSFLISWGVFLCVCVMHEGRKLYRALAGILISLLFSVLIARAVTAPKSDMEKLQEDLDSRLASPDTNAIPTNPLISEIQDFKKLETEDPDNKAAYETEIREALEKERRSRIPWSLTSQEVSDMNKMMRTFKTPQNSIEIKTVNIIYSPSNPEASSLAPQIRAIFEGTHMSAILSSNLNYVLPDGISIIARNPSTAQLGTNLLGDIGAKLGVDILSFEDDHLPDSEVDIVLGAHTIPKYAPLDGKTDSQP